jgi:hypothetical protein
MLRLIRQLLALLGQAFGGGPKEPGRRDKAAKTRCVPITDPAMRVPDPLVYAQEEMAALGLPVTWDNPDFTIFDGATPVAAHQLQPNRTYTVQVRIWNSAPDCPAVMMPVHLSYLDFGIGTVSVAVGTQYVDVGVLGASDNPSYARFAWHTPPTPGHYCLQALLDPASDRNRRNNLGQHNTDVVEAQSPAAFAFLLRNDTTRPHAYTLEADAFVLRPVHCSDDPPGRRVERLPAHEPLPPGWRVEINPATADLGPGAQVSISVTVTPPADFVGSQRVNVHAHYLDGHESRLAGGVSVDVTKGA